MKLSTIKCVVGACLIAGWAMTGCVVEVTETEPEPAPFELIGNWDTDYGSSIAITDLAWSDSSLAAYDNDANWAVTQYPADDEYSPNLFAKHVWTEPAADGSFWQCTVFFSGVTMEEAMAAEDISDATDLTVAGCGGFPWTQFGPEGYFDFELNGDWDTDFGEAVLITNESWGASALVAYDNDLNWAVTQYPEDDEYSPNLFAKHVWSDLDVDGTFWHCTVFFSGETLEEAIAAEDISDATDPDKGCGGFPWTLYGPVGYFE